MTIWKVVLSNRNMVVNFNVWNIVGERSALWTCVFGVLFWNCVWGQSVCEQHKTVFTSVLTGTIMDGPSAYNRNQRCEWLILSPNSTRYPYISLKIVSLITECGYDYVMAFDGGSYDSPLLATLSGGSASLANLPSYKIMATNGKMLVYFFSDMNKEYDGFRAFFKITECPNECSGHGQCKDNRCHCYENWSGVDCGHLICPENCGNRGVCQMDTVRKKCHCSHGHIGQTCQMSLNNDSENWWTLIYDYQREAGSDGVAGHAGVYISPYYYVFGGFNLKKPIGKLLRYDFQDNKWLLLEQHLTKPSARFFHSMTSVIDEVGEPNILLYGGDKGLDTLNDETWIFDTFTSYWRKHMPQDGHILPPALCQHAATLVKIEQKQFVYIFGGRTSMSRDEGLSSDMYRFDWAKQRWEKVSYDQGGVKSSTLRVAGHSMIYDELDDTLVLFGGLRMDSEQRAVYSSLVFLYNVKASRWAEIAASKPLSFSTYNIDARAFHTANVIGDYMIVHGGSYRKEPNMCYSRKTHFYNLRCHAWVKGLLKARPAPNGVFGHTSSVVNNSVLLVHGGYNGVMSGQLLGFKLPKLSTEYNKENRERACAKHGEKSCSSDYLNECYWNGRKCIRHKGEMPICGSVCHRLKDCLSCTTFRSYSRNSVHGLIANQCGWCIYDSNCYDVTDKGNLGACSDDASKVKPNSWWDVNNTLLLQNSAKCLTEDKWAGAVATEYHDTPDFSRPDKVSFLTEVDVKWNNMKGNLLLKIRGFLRPKSFKEKYLRMKLSSTQGASRILLSSNEQLQDPKMICSAAQENELTSKVCRLIELEEVTDERQYIEIIFNHTGTDHWNGKVEVEWVTSHLKKNMEKFSVLSSTNLEPYQSALVPNSLMLPSCKALTNCLSCLSDTSCAWCETRSVCQLKTVLARRPRWCSPINLTGSPYAGIIIVPESCTVCSDFPTCSECVTGGYCEWRSDACVRRSSAGQGTISLAKCPMPCHKRQDCMSCLLDEDKTGASMRCAWCLTSRKCYKLTRFHLAAFSFGQCHFWVQNQNGCPVCTKHTNCSNCLQSYRCGWCSLQSNPLQGYCAQGEFSSTNETCDSQQLTAMTVNKVGLMSWSYDSCPDVDECELKEWPRGNFLHTCSANATCINTAGSYFCECNAGFDGDGHVCERACFRDCIHGHCSGFPDYVCVCNLGWTSSANFDNQSQTACDTDCNCNFLSTCSKGQGQCDMCRRNTSGSDCGKCLPGHYRVDGEGAGCHQCQCNGHGNAELAFCTQNVGDCYCQHNTRGNHCEFCEDGYIGNPRNGGTCYRQCEGRLELYEDVGAFGFWGVMAKTSGSFLKRRIENNKIIIANCEWTIEAQNHTENHSIIKITLEKSINVSCYTEKVMVYDGRPGGDMVLLAEFCGFNWTNDVTVYARSGFATVHYVKSLQYDVDWLPSNNASFSAKYVVLASDVRSSSLPSSILSLDLKDSRVGVSEGLCLCNTECNNHDTSSKAPIQFCLEWSNVFDDNGNASQPCHRTGHVLLGIGSSLWLHGGISNGRALADIWSYDTELKTWSLHVPEKHSQPSGRFYHAAAQLYANSQFYIYGGILDGGNASAEMWLFTSDEAWKEINVSSSLPSLAGHTLTFCGGKAYIIGGYSPMSGFNRQVWIFDASRNEASIMHRSESKLNIRLFYGHSAVCDHENAEIYIFGGMEASILQFPIPTDAVYVLDTKHLEWKPILLKNMEGLSPQPRAFHAASNLKISTTNGMIVIGGKLANSESTREIWFFKYLCKKWIRLSLEGEGIQMSASLAVVKGKHYVYGGVLGGQVDSILLVMSEIRTPLFANLTAINDSFNCLPPNAIISGIEPKIDCSSLRDCRSCLNVYSLCHWCEPQSDNILGQCQPKTGLCSSGVLVYNASECNNCLLLPPASCNSMSGCIWTEAEYMNTHYNKIVASCICKKDRLWRGSHVTAPSKQLTKKPALPRFCANCQCPASCNVYTTCKTCLEIEELQGNWRYCMWSLELNLCIDPAYVPLVCPPGGSCGVMANKGALSCPISKCDLRRSCWECNSEPLCLWLQHETAGGCYDDATSKNVLSTGIRWYYECPSENECAMDLDDCLQDDENREMCHDLQQGYECVCQDGYNRTFPDQICSPVCAQGCIKGQCIEPDTCICQFGYTGANCSISCKCNGHSNCKNEANTTSCVKCHNNTIGNQCELCKAGFFGDPTRNISCKKCQNACHEKSENCTSKSGIFANYGPTPEDVQCHSCRDYSFGDRCEKCMPGYFKLKGKCHKCECNGHGETCDESTGAYCKCQNHTTSSDDKCNSPQSTNRADTSDCWRKQCDKCKASYQGNPKNGSHCFKHIKMEQEVCISNDAGFRCSDTEYDINEHTVNKFDQLSLQTLSAGQTVLFAINPQYTNVDIRIFVEITYGELSLFLSDHSDAFHIETDSFIHKVIPREKNVLVRRNKRSLVDNTSSDYLNTPFLQSFDEMIRMERALPGPKPESGKELKLLVVNASKFNSFTSFLPNSALRIDGIRNRVVVTISHTKFNLKSAKFYVILLGKFAPNSKDFVKLNESEVYGRTAGQLVYRQDQTNIDLFVFFSVFFSCFFLFLAICIVAWKLKRAADLRQVRLAQNIEMRHMASRPFATAYIVLDDYIPRLFFYSRNKNKFRNFSSLNSVSQSVTTPSQLFQASSDPVLKKSGLESLNGTDTCGLNLSLLEPTSLSLPVSPRIKLSNLVHSVSRNVGFTNKFQELVRANPATSASSITSPGSGCSSDQFIVISSDPDISQTETPLLNSTTTYINQNPDNEIPGQIVPLAPCSSGSSLNGPSPSFYAGSNKMQTIVSLNEQGRRRTTGITTADGNNSCELPSSIFEPRMKSYSTANLSDNEHCIYCISNHVKHFTNKEPHKCGAVLTNRMQTKGKNILAIRNRKGSRPLAFEITENHSASVNTVLLQLPGGIRAPVPACLGSALVDTRNISSTKFGSELRTPKLQPKVKTCKNA